MLSIYVRNDNPDQKIKAIKTLRSASALLGDKLPLREAKAIIDVSVDGYTLYTTVVEDRLAYMVAGAINADDSGLTASVKEAEPDRPHTLTLTNDELVTLRRWGASQATGFVEWVLYDRIHAMIDPDPSEPVWARADYRDNYDADSDIPF